MEGPLESVMGAESADDATGVFLVRAEPGDYERTVASPVDLAERDDRPEALAEVDEARLWSVPDGDRNADRFDQMEAGDLLLFHRDGRYVGIGRVGRTFEDDDWANEALGDGEPTSRVYTVEDFSEIDVGRAAVHRIFDYSASYSPGDLMRVADDRVSNSLDAIALAVRRFDERSD